MNTTVYANDFGTFEYIATEIILGITEIISGGSRGEKRVDPPPAYNNFAREKYRQSL